MRVAIGVVCGTRQKQEKNNAVTRWKDAVPTANACRRGDGAIEKDLVLIGGREEFRRWGLQMEP